MKPSRKPKQRQRQLELRKERVRELTTADQQRVVGGVNATTICVDDANDTSRCITTAA